MPVSGHVDAPSAPVQTVASADGRLARGIPTLPVRLIQARDLLRTLIRTTRWSALAGAAVVAPIVVRWVGGSNPSPTDRIGGLRVGAMVLAIGSAFLLDDPTEETTAHLPTRISWRRMLRGAIATLPLATAWCVLALTAPEPAGPDVAALPLGALSLEFAAMAMAALAIAAAATHLVPDGLGGVAAAPVLMTAMGILAVLPPRIRLFVGHPLEPRWGPTHRVWWLILASGLALLMLASADRGRPGLVARFRRVVRKPGERRSPGSRTLRDPRRP